MSVLSLIRLRQTALATLLTLGLAACAAGSGQPTAQAPIDTSLGQLPTRAGGRGRAAAWPARPG